MGLICWLSLAGNLNKLFCLWNLSGTIPTSVAMMHSSFSSDMTYTDWYFVSFEVEYTDSGRFLSDVSLKKEKKSKNHDQTAVFCDQAENVPFAIMLHIQYICNQHTFLAVLSFSPLPPSRMFHT